jgi:hypothetical protein
LSRIRSVPVVTARIEARSVSSNQGRRVRPADPEPRAPRRAAQHAGSIPSAGRLTVRRVRLRSVARVGCSLGWLISLLPAIIASALAVWVLHGIWTTLNGWTPWSPWEPGQRMAGIPLPNPPVFRPREALRVEGVYQFIEPVGRHPFVATLLGALALTLLGGALLALIFLLTGAGYNTFARLTGGIEFDVTPAGGRPARPAPDDPRRQADAEHDWDDAELQW